MDNGPGGFTEAGICTKDLGAWVRFLSEVGAYREIWRGTTDRPVLKAWGCPSAVRAEEVLMGLPGSSSGHIRLFRISGMPQEVIRAGTHTWDSGGIFDLDVRVRDVLALAGPIEQSGWTGVAEPVDWPFKDLQVREWLTIGPDSVTFALVQRLSPPLASPQKLQGFGHVFNSSQVVADMDRSVDFYETLGFRKILTHSGPLGGRGGELLGLPPESAARTPVDLVILQPRGEMDGSVELVKIYNVPGFDVVALAEPYNLGLNLLRFPVGDLAAYAEQLDQRGIERGAQIPARIEPYGKVRVFSVRSPDGVWIEFYQEV